MTKILNGFFFLFVWRVRTPQFGRNGFSLTCATICMKNIHTTHESYVRMYSLYRVKQHPSIGIHRSRKNRSMAFTRTQYSTATLQTVLLIEQGLTSAPTHTADGFYRAMHFSAKRGIAITSSVRLSVTLVDCDHIRWNSSKIISP